MAFAQPGTVNTSAVPLWSATGLTDEFWKVIQDWWWVPVILVAIILLLWALRK